MGLPYYTAYYYMLGTGRTADNLFARSHTFTKNQVMTPNL
jgi:hypothetical protein